MKVKKGFKKIASWMWHIVTVVIFFIIAIPFLLYLPPFQTFMKDVVTKEVKKSTGMDITIDYLRLRFPLQLDLERVAVIDSAATDTMLYARKATLDVALLPLLRGDIDVERIGLDSVRYQLGTPDSLMYMTVAINRASIDNGLINLSKSTIDVDKGRIEGARIHLVLKPDTTVAPLDTTPSTPWLIKARDIEMMDVHYTMEMLPYIDTLKADISKGRLRNGTVDIGNRSIHASSLMVDGLDAIYKYPSEAFLKEHPELIVEPVDTLPTLPSDLWTIRADSIGLHARKAIYAMTGAIPQRGLDMNWLEATGIDISVENFFNRGVEISVPVKTLKGRERCGISLDASGLFEMDSTMMRIKNFNVNTDASHLAVRNGEMGMSEDLSMEEIPLALDADAVIGISDLLLAYPDLAGTLKGMSKKSIKAKTNLTGSMAALQIKGIDIEAAGIVNLKAKGNIYNALDFEKIGGKINLDGSVSDGSLLTSIIPKGMLPPELRIPALTLAGDIDYSPGKVAGNLTGTTRGGKIALQGNWTARTEGYDAHLSLDRFPVDAFMPSLGVGAVTATLDATGHGYNPLSPTTGMDIRAKVDDIVYNGSDIEGIKFSATAGNGIADGSLSSTHPAADLDIDFHAELTARSIIDWRLDGDIRELDLKALGFSDDVCQGAFTITSEGTYNTSSGDIDGTLGVDNLFWSLPESSLVTSSADIDLKTTHDNVYATLTNGDLNARLVTMCPLDTLMARVEKFPQLMDSFITMRRVDIDRLQRIIPPMEFTAEMADNNLVTDFLLNSNIVLDNMSLELHNDSLLRLSAFVGNLQTGSITLDSIKFDAYQRENTLVYNLGIDNMPGTLDEFAHVKVNGFLAENRLSAFLTQKNLQGEQGFNLGLLATLSDSVATARFVPYTPTIAYKKWTLNSDNYISWNLNNSTLEANLRMSNNSSSIYLFTTSDDDTDHPSELIARITDIKLADWLSISPFAPPVSGDLSADIHLDYRDKLLEGHGNMKLNDFYYDKRRVGSFDAGFDVSTDPASGFMKADLDLSIDSIRAMKVSGILNDSTATTPLQLDFHLIRFPLSIANPFIPSGMATLNGALCGEMAITGTSERPQFNGHINFDSTTVKVGMIGTTLKFDNAPIKVKDNVVEFDDFTISAINDNPLYINGTVDLDDLINYRVDLNIYGSDIQVVNSTRPKGASVYGKGFLDINAYLKGTSRFMRANATVNLLPGSNVTYVMADEAATLSTVTDPDMVHFVQFNNPEGIEAADSLTNTSLAMLLEANLIISEGTTINVDLSANGTNKVSINGAGNLTYTSSPISDGRLVGRYTINSGFVRYTPPMMSEKLFRFVEGSSVAFNGDMMNPILNLKAIDTMKANVTREGENSRLVNFDISLAVTNTLENMNIAFDLSTNDDITVSNELASMSADQRANQAMNMLLYGVYTGAGTKGNANMSGNLLYAFLESQLNNWLASNIHGVDITFGIDQYNRTFNGSTSTATNYSYHVSKTLFNDRFKIIVGGTYSTADENDENAALGLINDISAEYMLNQSGSMYVKIFRHVGYENILEGEITQTGVGFVYKRRLRSLKDMFRFGSSKKSVQPQDTTATGKL